MTLLDKIKSLLGLETSRPEPSDDRDVGVTVEHEPDEEGADAEADEESTETDEPDTDEPSTEEPEPEADEAEPEADEADEPEQSGEPEGDLEDVKGIGPSYADRLRDAGIETIADLADADAEAVASESDLSEGRLEEWIESAQNR